LVLKELLHLSVWLTTKRFHGC